MANITAPYTKSIALDVIAKYGYSEVALDEDDVIFTLSNDAIGTISGNVLTATDDMTVTDSGVVTAKLVCNEAIVATANVTLGRASEIVYDFESGSDSIANWYLSYKSPYTPDKYYFNDEIDVVSASDGGKVKSGDYALRITCDGDSITCMNWCQTRINGLGIDLTDAVSISFWMYIPEGSHGYEWDFGNAIPVVLGHEFTDGTGWQYFTVNVSDIGTNVTSLDQIKLYHSDTNNGDNGYKHYEHPNYYADVVYYMDDITVNYSTAVDDYQAPIISDAAISYEGIDTSVAINGQTIASNVVAVTANAKDNMDNSNYTGIDMSSVAVYVDGVKVNASCNDNGLITTGDITLANGTHIFRFEISDNNGNMAYIEKSVVLAGDSEKNTVIYAPADPSLKDVLVDSLVWMNLAATEIENVESITAVIDLDNNNKWELEHIVLADGFEATYEVDAENNDAKITITSVGNTSLTGETVIASLPVRVWSPAFPNIGNEDTYSYRLVSVMSYVQMGLLTEKDGSTTTFSSEMNTVSTEYNSTRLTSVASKSSWHTHTAVALDDKAATCTADGYTGRTFCEVCNSVVEWGETVPATGHTYKVIDGKYSCECGDVNAMTGLIKDGDVYRYIYNGTVRSGWFAINNEWYYFSSSTMAAVSGRNKVGGIYYDFEETGKLVSGVWAKNMKGTRYYYGPSYYDRGWYTIDGVDYYFKNGYRCENIDCQKGSGMPTIWYDFGPDGASATKLNGVFDIEGEFRYFEEGVATEKFLVKVGNDYYYTTYNGKVATNKTLTTAATNCDLSNGTYTFGADGKMIGSSAEGEIVEIDGVLYYYVSGKGVEAGLVEVDGNYYCAGYKGELVMGKAVTIKVTSCDLPAGTYEFDANGVILNGIVEKEGILYYYENGKGAEKGLICIDGDYYFTVYKGKVAVNTTIKTWMTNCDLPNGTYEFGADGKMLNGIVDKDGVLYYYENGQGVEKGLVCVDGDYYFSAYKGKLVVGKTLKTWMTNCDLPNGTYEFGADGKMLNGIVDKDGVLYYYENGQGVEKGLICVDGDYYFTVYKGKIIVDKTVNTWATSCDLPNGTYEFGPDGKMLNGIVENDGVLYYYENGQGVEKGLICVDGDYYFTVYKGKIIVDKTVNTWATSCDLPNGTYEFGADGKMLNGIVEKDGALYYYENGKAEEKGLICIDGDYYFVAYKGKIAVNQTVSTWLTNCDLPNGKYEFGADGKMLDGIVEKDGVLYYYENGVGVEKGLFFYEGYYYFSVYQGKLVVGKDYNVWQANGLLIEQIYTFNELGQIVA